MKTKNIKLNILLIEDSNDDILLAQIALKETKLIKDIWVAKNGEKALELIQKLRHNKEVIDLILMDINLPLINGLEILKELKSNPTTKEYPVAIFTSSDLESDMNLSNQYKADFFIKKPNNINEYIEIMKNFTNYAFNKKINLI